MQIVRDYTREAGLRNLERQIGAVCRKAAIKIADGSTTTVLVESKDIAGFLGKPSYFGEVAERTETPGVATGLAWTPVGGDILSLKPRAFPVSGRLILNRSAGRGDERERAGSALSLVKARSAS